MNSDNVTKVILSTIKEHILLSIGIVAAVSGAIITSIIPPLVLARVIDTITGGKTLPVMLTLLYFCLSPLRELRRVSGK